MMPFNLYTSDLQPLKDTFGERLQEDVSLARYTAARLGGPAEAFLEVHSANELAEAAKLLWQWDIPYTILGGGSNVLVSDAGVRGVVLLNRARSVRFEEQAGSPSVWAESGANFGLIARQAAQRGLSGLEWAAGIPGTLGGAVVGNAGAHGGDMAGNLELAEILHLDEEAGQEQPRREAWPQARLGLEYRSSIFKRRPGKAVVLSAVLKLKHSSPQAVQARLDEYVAYRRRTQPPGASMGSMFKNPPGDYAGRLIEAAGMKGIRIGNAQISSLHANFFINQGEANAADVFSLIQMARQAVANKFGVKLELEIELVGEWSVDREA
jgi:UDP-N-acetylmuramate dehydrogenase